MSKHNKKPVYDQLPKIDKKTGKTKQNGILNLDTVAGKTGVYRIYERGELVFVGSSGKDLKPAIASHFHQYQGKKRPASNYRHRLGQYSYEYMVDECPPSQTDKLAKQLIKKHKPRDNQ